MDSTAPLSRRGFVGLAASASALRATRGGRPDADAHASRLVPCRPLAGAEGGCGLLQLQQATPGGRHPGRPPSRGQICLDQGRPLAAQEHRRRRKAVVQKFRDAGITPLSCGVVGMTDDESQLRNAFEYARDAGIPTIVCKPTRESLSVLDKLVKEFDLKLAIHNHGPEDKVWPSPFDVWEAIQKYDERIGVCVDVGHTSRCGVDPVRAIRTCAARLYDVHLKDLSSTGSPSRSRSGAACSTSAGCCGPCWTSATATMSASSTRRT